MSMWSTFLLVHVFTALLPPPQGRPGDTTTADADQARDFYEILGVSKHSRTIEDDVRKAYKKKSLELHPDKIAQRRLGAEYAQQAAKEYLLVQEAHAVLSDRKLRKLYHAVNCSAVRYRFIKQGGLMHPTALMQNLAEATLVDKTRLVLLCTLALLLALLQPILICSKVNGMVKHNGNLLADAPWTLLLIPLWVLNIFFIFLWAILLLVIPEPSVRPPILCTLLELIAWFVGEVWLAKTWDDNNDNVLRTGRDNTDWHVLAIPFYLAVIFRLAGHVCSMRQIQAEQDSMVSTEWLQQELYEYKEQQEQNTSSMENELTDEELLERLVEERGYTVVSVNEAVVQTMLDIIKAQQPSQSHDDNNPNPILSREELEALRVETSPEFRATEEAIRDVKLAFGNALIFGLTQIALIALQLEDQLSSNYSQSWWIVFLPTWIYLGVKILGSCCVCICGVGGGDNGPMPTIVIQRGHDHEDDDDDKNNKNNHTTERNPEKDEFHNEGVPPTTTATTSNGVHPTETTAPTSTSLIVRKNDDDDHDDDEDHHKLNESANAFVVPTSDIQDFNSPAKQMETGAATAATRNSNEAEKKAATPTDTTQTSDDNDNKDKDNNNNNENDDDDDNNPNFHFDAEAFHRWQQLHAQQEHSMMEAQAKAQYTCCTATFQLMILCLMIGKLQQDYNEDPTQAIDPDEYQPGYDAFWILFPIFLITGLLLCCCSCLIYSAGHTAGLDDLVQKASAAQADADHDDDDEENAHGRNNHNNKNSTMPQSSSSKPSDPVIVVPPPPPNTTNGTAAAPSPSQQQQPPSTASPPIANNNSIEMTALVPSKDSNDDINDLD